MTNYCKVPCKHCPFRNDVKPFLHPDRAYEIAIGASNPYSDFFCHKTTEYNEDDNGYDDMIAVENSLQCAGFLTLRAQEGIEVPEGFEPSWEICYIDAHDMYEAYEEEWNEKQSLRKEQSI